VDRAIATTRRTAEQTERLRKVLLPTLMTRGIGHTRFKQTAIGELPEKWGIVRLESLLAAVEPAMRSGPFGSALLKEELTEDGVPLLGIDNIHIEEFRREFTRFVSEEKFAELSRYAVRPRDVVITIMGTVGRACVLPEDVPRALSSKHLWTLSIDHEIYLPELVSLQLNYAPWVRSHFTSHAQGGIMSALRSDVLRGVQLPYPPIPEQRRIHSVLGHVADMAAGSRMELRILETLKRGLLQDLLTGRVRVKPD
jgi:type I restriction enzyme S subunit